jgi:hypothetical protein
LVRRCQAAVIRSAHRRKKSAAAGPSPSHRRKKSAWRPSAISFLWELPKLNRPKAASQEKIRMAAERD